MRIVVASFGVGLCAGPAGAVAATVATGREALWLRGLACGAGALIGRVLPYAWVPGLVCAVVRQWPVPTPPPPRTTSPPPSCFL